VRLGYRGDGFKMVGKERGWEGVDNDFCGSKQGKVSSFKETIRKLRIA
jgi:hypothetical protein